ncbi:protein-glutamate O-methyltransferase CheR [Conexibacter sp. SYSU D00693]|uniref:CheR family methyltransferase n=1 Tax=Conexibacter sp. SYSU D00693 TaxID=2812560 RepID=UPI00196A9B42|nr:protein-glutamate O-methyltransferase CheR [Conexibacter sp. SYSU D00693]
MTEALDDAAALLRDRSGLALDAHGRDRLREALAQEGARRGLAEAELVARAAQERELLQALVDGATLQETSFFRDPAVFDALRDEVLPRLDDPVVVWSAGCADGHEPYSLAMLLAESGRRGWRVVGTDVSSAALRRARGATYPERRLRGLSAERRARFLEPASDGASRVVAQLRDHVVLAQHNLATDPPPLEAQGAGLVLCRNVLIYLDPDATRGFLDRLHDWLAPGALLVAGAAESLLHLTTRFRLVPLGPGFVYRRDLARPSTPAPSPRPPVPRQPSAAPPRRRGPGPPALPPAPDAAALDAAGQEALAAGRTDEAVGAFRRVVYLDPDGVLGHLHLGLALEAAGDAGATRAFRAARAALRRTEPRGVAGALGGYRVEELERMLAAKLEDDG